MKREKEKTKKSGNGFGLRLTMAIFLYLAAASCLVGVIMIGLTRHSSFSEWCRKAPWEYEYIANSKDESMELENYDKCHLFVRRNYAFSSEDTDAKIFTFVFGGEEYTQSIEYENLNCYTVQYKDYIDYISENPELGEPLPFLEYCKENSISEEIFNNGTYDEMEEIEFNCDNGELSLSINRRYVLSSVDANAKTFTFVNELTGDTEVIAYENLNCYEKFVRLNGWEYEGDDIVFITLLVVDIVFWLLSFLQTVFAVAGKKHKWANTGSIVIGAVFCLGLIGIFGIVGGLKSEPYRAKNDSPKITGSETDKTLEKAVGATVTKEAEIQKEAEIPEYIQSKISAKGKRGIMIALTVSYSLLLLVGVLLSAIPAAGKIISGMGICEEQNSRAYGLAIGVMWVALVPAIGYYFAMLSPFKVSKKVRATIAVLTTVLLVAMIAVFFIVINCVKLPVGEEKLAVKKFFEGSDSWFIPISTAFASLGIALCYLTLLFRIKPENGKSDRGALKVVKGVLRAKEKYPDAFILAASVLLTWLAHFVAFVISVIVIVIFIGVIAMFLLKVLSIDSGVSRAIDVATGGDGNSGKKEYTFINDMGCEQTVYSADGKTFYNADGSYAGKSNDGGKTINN